MRGCCSQLFFSPCFTRRVNLGMRRFDQATPSKPFRPLQRSKGILPCPARWRRTLKPHPALDALPSPRKGERGPAPATDPSIPFLLGMTAGRWRAQPLSGGRPLTRPSAGRSRGERRAERSRYLGQVYVLHYDRRHAASPPPVRKELWLPSLAKRHDFLFQSLSKTVLFTLEVVAGLEIQPEPIRCAEIPRQAKSRIGR